MGVASGCEYAAAAGNKRRMDVSRKIPVFLFFKFSIYPSRYRIFRPKQLAYAADPQRVKHIVFYIQAV